MKKKTKEQVYIAEFLLPTAKVTMRLTDKGVLELQDYSGPQANFIKLSPLLVGELKYLLTLYDRAC